MIFDTISNAGQYSSISPLIAKALKIAAETNFAKLETGRYEVEGDRLYYLVQRYQTKPTYGKLEAHRKYIDLQYVAKGVELMGVSFAEKSREDTPYDEKIDAGFYKESEETSFLKMSSGDFVVLWPNDAHMPCCQIDQPQDVLKVVFKIKV